MPNQEKVELVSELLEELKNSSALLMTDYRGLRVTEIQGLRKKLRDVGADYKVVKNTLFLRAAQANGDEGLEGVLAGPTAVAFVRDDPVASAKVIVDYLREHKAMSVKGGYVEGRVYGADQIVALSKVPPRDQLRAMMVGSIQAPLVGLVGTLQGVLSGVVFTLQAIADQKSA